MTELERIRAEHKAQDREAVAQALTRFGGCVARAARSLGMSRTAFYRRLVKYGMAEEKADGRRKLVMPLEATIREIIG